MEKSVVHDVELSGRLMPPDAGTDAYEFVVLPVGLTIRVSAEWIHIAGRRRSTSKPALQRMRQVAEAFVLARSFESGRPQRIGWHGSTIDGKVGAELRSRIHFIRRDPGRLDSSRSLADALLAYDEVRKAAERMRRGWEAHRALNDEAARSHIYVAVEGLVEKCPAVVAAVQAHPHSTKSNLWALAANDLHLGTTRLERLYNAVQSGRHDDPSRAIAKLRGQHWYLSTGQCLRHGSNVLERYVQAKATGRF